MIDIAALDGVYSFVLTRVGGGQKVAYGTFDGVPFPGFAGTQSGTGQRLALTDVAQVDVLDDYGLLIVSSGVSYISFPPTGV